ncbi:MAG: DnaB-like helicase C-terminal domain-containing protein [Pikeienuella sp.]
MNTVISLHEPPADAPTLPHDQAIEQALLGALLIDNRIYDAVADSLRAHHFYVAVHGRIFEAIAAQIAKNMEANPTTLRFYFENDTDLEQAGGGQYLTRLVSSALTTVNAPDYARTIVELATRRSLILLAEDLGAAARQPNLDTDARDIGSDFAAEIGLLVEHTGGVTIDMAQASTSAIEALERARETGGASVSVKTGLRDLDAILGGLPRSEVTIIAGRPGMGKTALVSTIAQNIATAGIPVDFETYEMKADHLVTRMMAIHGNVDADAVRKGRVDDATLARLRDVEQEFRSLPVYFNEDAATIAGLTARARAMNRRGQCEVLIVDYLGLMEVEDRYRGNKVHEIEQITRGLKRLANELDIPVALCCQLNRQVEQRDDKRPSLADLRDSGAIEQDAGLVLMLFREEYYLDRQRELSIDEHARLNQCRGQAEIIVAKNRHGAANRTIHLQFEARTTRFSNVGDVREGEMF